MSKYHIKIEELKPGDTIWHVLRGEMKIKHISSDPKSLYPIIIQDGCSYTKEGKNVKDATMPHLYMSDPFKEEKTSELPRLMKVKDSPFSAWILRVVFMFKNDRAIAWECADNLPDAEKINTAVSWSYYEEIEKSLPIVEMTLEDIAKLKGCTVEQLRIKD